jgi:hypothetical protein
MEQDKVPVKVDVASPVEQPKRRWWLDPALIVILVLVAIPFILMRLSHRPQLVYPEGANRAVLTVQASGRTINPKLVEYYSRLYGLDSTQPCIEGKKYATYCQDGELIWDVEEGVCSDHGGVKDWVVCR